MPNKNTVDVTFRRMEPFMSMGRIDAAVTRGPVFLPKVGEEFPQQLTKMYSILVLGKANGMLKSLTNDQPMNLFRIKIEHGVIPSRSALC